MSERAIEQTKEEMAECFSLYSWLFWTTEEMNYSKLTMTGTFHSCPFVRFPVCGSVSMCAVVIVSVIVFVIVSV